MVEIRRMVAATLCAAVALFVPNAADSLMLVPCGTMSDHYVKSDKEDMRVIKRGDTLWEISQEVYGNPARFPEIAKQSGISDPDLIFLGQVVRIPRREGYKFLGRLYDISGNGFCPITDEGGFQYIGRFNHPKGTTRASIR